MTRKVLYLSRRDMEDIDLAMIDIIEALEAMFSEKAAGGTQMPPKTAIYPTETGFIHSMPAYIPSLKSAGVKLVSGFRSNLEKGLPYISGLLVLDDAETGIPLCVMDCTWITAKRTGAATAVAAKYLARRDSEKVGIIACGAQGRSNLEALNCLFPIKKVHAYDIDSGTARAYATEMEKLHGVEVEVVSDLRQAVSGMDLVVTSGPILKNPQPTIEKGWLDEGAFASLVDYDCYWQGDAMRETHKLATDDIDQMEYYRRDGYFQDTPKPYAELGEIVSGKKPGRESDAEKTMTINLGLALDDMATAIKIYRRALDMGLGTDLPL